MTGTLPYARPERVIVLGGDDKVKIASLFFDHIIPVSFWEYPIELLPPEFQPGERLSSYIAFRAGLLLILKKTGGQSMINTQPELNEFERGFDEVLRDMFPHIRPMSADPVLADPHIARVYLENTAGARDEILRDLAGIGVAGSPLLVPEGALPHDAASIDDITITLANIPLVDITRASWEQILDFRKDLRSMAKLRRLRLFLYDNYMGKSSQYIQDAIVRDLEDYESCCKEHGFEFKTGVLSTVLDSKILLTTGLITLAAFLFGKASTGCIAAAIGSTIEIGKIILTIASKEHSLAQLRDTHPLAYIIEARETLM